MSVTKLEVIYLETCNLLEQLELYNSREKQIEHIMDFLDKRQELLTDLKISHPYSESEKEIGNKLVLLNQELDIKLLSLKNEISKDLSILAQKKKKQIKYHFTQTSFSLDGMYLDKKK